MKIQNSLQPKEFYKSKPVFTQIEMEQSLYKKIQIPWRMHSLNIKNQIQHLVNVKERKGIYCEQGRDIQHLNYTSRRTGKCDQEKNNDFFIMYDDQENY